jgi:hypothetical protein
VAAATFLANVGAVAVAPGTGVASSLALLTGPPPYKTECASGRQKIRATVPRLMQEKQKKCDWQPLWVVVDVIHPEHHAYTEERRMGSVQDAEAYRGQARPNQWDATSGRKKAKSQNQWRVP